MFIADLHAITVKHDPKLLKDQIIKTLATYIASGIDPKTTTIFIQSHIHEHAELAWILSCSSRMGELQRMHQFKEKSVKRKQEVSVGLFTYPVLMAADILLYDINTVPVGEDQSQHIQLVRDLAQRMNSSYGDDTFVIPEGIKPPVGAKIMSLQDPTAKMSKSDPDVNSTIFLSDSNDEIIKKFKKAVTDSGTEITFEDSKPGIKNLIEIQSAITGNSPKHVTDFYSGKLYGELKKDTADLVVSMIEPIRENTNRIIKNDIGYVMRSVYESTRSAKQIAKQTLKRVREKVGFIEKIILL